MKLNPRRIPGYWDEGYSLDFHIQSSEFLGYDEFGHPQFENTRTELGELLYQIKYKGDQSTVTLVAEAICGFLQRWNPGIDLIVPAPPSKRRKVQPLFQIADKVGEMLKLPLYKEIVRRKQKTPELKNVYDYSKRLELLKEAFFVDPGVLKGRRILLFDDLFRSGATLDAVARILKNPGGAGAIFALTLTRTRSSR